MNSVKYNILNLDNQFIENIDKVVQQNLNEELFGSYRTQNPPNFRYREETNLFPRILPNNDMIYKNKSMFGVNKPIQTEEDEIGVNQAFLNSHYGLFDYGYFKVQNQGLSNNPKKTPIDNLYEFEYPR